MKYYSCLWAWVGLVGKSTRSATNTFFHFCQQKYDESVAFSVIMPKILVYASLNLCKIHWFLSNLPKLVVPKLISLLFILNFLHVLDSMLPLLQKDTVSSKCHFLILFSDSITKFVLYNKLIDIETYECKMRFFLNCIMDLWSIQKFLTLFLVFVAICDKSWSLLRASQML